MGAAPSLRETITEAFDESEAEEAPEPAAAEPVETPAPEAVDEQPPETPEGDKSAAAPAEGDRSRNADGTFAKAPKKKPVAPPKAKEAKPAPADGKAAGAPEPAPAKVAPAEAPAAAQSETAPALKPPSSWKPQAREKWAGLPPEVQAEVARVDGEVRQVMQRAAGNQRIVDSVQRVIQPFEQMIRAEGHQPLQAVESLLRQAHLMRFGAPAAKAQFVEGLIERNQIPVDAGLVARLIQKNRIPIDALADALEGKVPMATASLPAGNVQVPGHMQPPDPNAIAEQVFARVDKRFQEQEFTRLRSAGEAFLSKQEFGEDVRGLVANLLELRAREGKAMTLEEAYAEALEIHPEVRKTLRQRADAEAAKAKAASTQKARAAASSVKSQPAGAPPAPKAKGLRGTLESVWAEAEGEA